MEEELVAKAGRYGIHIVGPNTMGIFSAKTNLHALMPGVMPLHGTVSMFSQSGNVGVQMLDYGEKENVGFEKFVSSGNEGDLSCVDYLQYFAQDEATKLSANSNPIDAFDFPTFSCKYDLLALVKAFAFNANSHCM